MAIGRGFGLASTLICYCCAYAVAAAVTTRVAVRCTYTLCAEAPHVPVSPLAGTASGEFDLNGFLLKRLVEMCLDDAAAATTAAPHRCDARHLVKDAEEIGFSAEHGLAFYRLVNFCSGEQRLSECAALTAGLARKLLLGEDEGVRFRRLIDSFGRSSPQVVADATLLLTAQPAAAGDGDQRRRRRDIPTVAQSADAATGNHGHADDDYNSATGAAEAVAADAPRNKRSVSPFMFALYSRYSQPCGGGVRSSSSSRPLCPTSSGAPRRYTTRGRLVDE